MRLIEIVNARHSLQKLVAQDLPIRTAYALMKITDECNRHLEFYGQEIGKFDPGKNPERLAELDNMEISIDMERIIISLDGDLKLSAGDVKMLMPLVEFQ